MITLQQFLNQESSVTLTPDDTELSDTGFMSLLTDLSMIQVSGIDAASFLHNQLSNDVEHLGENEARLAAYCTPKGRMLASMMFWKTSEDIFIQIHSSVQSSTQKRLQMFVMRAKATLVNVTDQYVTLGIGGATAARTLQQWFPSLPENTNEKIDNTSGTLIRSADAFGYPRYQWIMKTALLENHWDSLQEILQPVSPEVWRRGEILAGIPRIIEKTQEQFVPQMVNFELIGGVNFKKGCYPGQEIVARSQYLGKLKRRMSIAKVATLEIHAGMDVFSENDSSQPCGMIVNAESNGNKTSVCLVELKVADKETGNIYLGSGSGPILEFLPLPYQMTDVTQ